jgi:hypothetical protein
MRLKPIKRSVRERQILDAALDAYRADLAREEETAEIYAGLMRHVGHLVPTSRVQEAAPTPPGPGAWSP